MFQPQVLRVLMLSVMTGTVTSKLDAEQDTLRNRYQPYPAVHNIATGLAWPAGQALPTFATPVSILDAIEVQALSVDERHTFVVLQGLINRVKPRLLLLDARADEGRDTWIQTATVGIESTRLYSHDNRYDLLAKYAAEPKGLVLYDPNRSHHHRNLAGTVAGLKQLLPVTAQVLEQMRHQGINLEVMVDLTNVPHTTPVAIYEYLYETYWPECEKRVLISARPYNSGGDHHHTRDLAAACGAAIVWLDNRDPAEREVMRKFLGDMQAGNAVILGWYSTERSGITTASEFGIATLPADHYISSSVFSGTEHRIQIPPTPKKPPLENKAYLAIFISDGDNIQYTQRAMRRVWDTSSNIRGKVPLNWTIAPGLVDIGPSILNYYYTTATSLDCFVTGPSGMGYLMPVNTFRDSGARIGVHLSDRDRMDGYARLTETYLQRSGIRVVTIWDDATAELRASYEQHCRNLYGATVQNFRDVPSVAGSVENQRVRFEKLVIPYTGTYEHISHSIRAELERWDRQSPLFLAYQVNVWGELKPNKIVEFAGEINAQYGDLVQFVRADHYFNLYNESHQLPFNLALSPTASVSTSAGQCDPQLAFDGTPSTYWETVDQASAELLFDLGDHYRLSRYVIRHAGDAGLLSAQNTRDFTIEVSLDGKSWTTADRFRDNVYNVTDVEIDPVSAQYAKLTIEHPGEGGTIRVADVELYGTHIAAD